MVSIPFSFGKFQHESNGRPAILFNRKTRSIKCPGIAGARIRPGTERAQNHSGMGDCIFMDFSKGFFAVSDSPSRNSTASKRFLLKFSKLIDNLTFFDPGHICPFEKLREVKLSLTKKSEEVLQTIPYTESCTFTGILIARTDSGIRGILFHTGDSILFQCVPKTAELEQITTSNFWMVGRSRLFFQVDEVEIIPESIIIITTDGFFDLNFTDNADRRDFILNLATSYSVEEIPDMLLENNDLNRAAMDDMGIISLKPERLRLIRTKVFMGGTTEKDEKKHQERCNNGVYEDRYMPLSSTDS